MSFNLNIDKHTTIHFIGIGGISMSAIALLLKDHGYNVTGSDRSESDMVKTLKAKGIPVSIGQKKENIHENSIIVYTFAVKEDNEEYIRSQELGLPMYSRAEFLGLVMKNYKYSIGVSGTHGKTTTTSMASHVLLSGNTDPTLFVGGALDAINGNLRIGESEYFLTEACEYKESFLNFFPYIGIILNIDEDHLDYYRDIHHIEEVFIKYAQSIPKNGYLIMNNDDIRASKVINSCSCNKITFGLKSGMVRAIDINYDSMGCGYFKVEYNNNTLGEIHLNIPGEHNIYNSLAAIASGIALNIPFNSIAEGLFDYKGTHRRFEIKGEVNGAIVVDDYAHHPTEIINALNAGRKLTKGKLYCAFQPHTYTRTHSLLKEFSECFGEADEVIVADIYAAREKDTGIINSQILSDKIKENNINCTYIGKLDAIAEYIAPKLTEGDVLMLVGAGDINTIWEKIKNI
ncbi:UDP-N-acetylmuramate--L-alanine ligase [Oceanirhabdus sp. W0125-5]|uniref:UDP-N-acetylmuramate--L-alanine ligase n=1 Tax=Oceanirhabdus sp. W0125-5 TaxID=2999116 RepID=UPI0022F32AEE|nr:UDP-N-acetylmuramate--L-alanine ligase [Oceanirhabdus sp. W0125-5]WBW97917.1 UDP-N-acetylmuramate--L-alanine ligase [Oceanirhabdus sp. W0125-5]